MLDIIDLQHELYNVVLTEIVPGYYTITAQSTPGDHSYEQYLTEDQRAMLVCNAQQLIDALTI